MEFDDGALFEPSMPALGQAQGSAWLTRARVARGRKGGRWLAHTYVYIPTRVRIIYNASSYAYLVATCTCAFTLSSIDRCYISHITCLEIKVPRPETRPDGPGSWSELHFFMRRSTQSILLQNPGVIIGLNEYCAEGHSAILLSSKWAGFGTSTICTDYLIDALQTNIAVDLPVEYWAAFDCAPHCKDILAASKCKHVFSNVVLGAEQHWLTEFADMNDALLASLEQQKREGASSKQIRKQINKLNDEYKTWVLNNKHTFSHDIRATADCHKCHEPCLLRCEAALNIDVVSPTCTSWSAQGLRLGWIDRSNQPLVVWCLALEFNKPVIFVLECVPGMDYVFLRQLAPSYLMDPIIIDPVDFGFPVSGKRLFIRGTRSNAFAPQLPFQVSFIADHFFVKRRLTAKVFVQSKPKDIIAFLNMQAKSKHNIRPFMRFPRDCSVLLTSKERVRLSQHEDKAQAWRRSVMALEDDL